MSEEITICTTVIALLIAPCLLLRVKDGRWPAFWHCFVLPVILSALLPIGVQLAMPNTAAVTLAPIIVPTFIVSLALFVGLGARVIATRGEQPSTDSVNSFSGGLLAQSILVGAISAVGLFVLPVILNTNGLIVIAFTMGTMFYAFRSEMRLISHYQDEPANLGANKNVAPGQYPTRVVMGSDFHSEFLAPITFQSGIATSQMLTSVLQQLELALKGVAMPPKYRLIRLKTLGCKTVLSTELESSSVGEIYSLGIECNGSLTRTIGALRLNSVGNSVSVVMDSKETIAISKNASVWLVSALFPEPKRPEQAGPDTSGAGFFAMLAFMGSLAIGYWPGFLIAGGIGGVVSAIVVTIGFMMGAQSLRIKKQKQSEEFRMLVRLALMQSYQSIVPIIGTQQRAESAVDVSTNPVESRINRTISEREGWVRE